MAYLDNSDKVQCSVSDIKVYGGVDLVKISRLSSSERYILICDMISYIRANNVVEFQDLIGYVFVNEVLYLFFLFDNLVLVVVRT